MAVSWSEGIRLLPTFRKILQSEKIRMPLSTLFGGSITQASSLQFAFSLLFLGILDGDGHSGWLGGAGHSGSFRGKTEE